MTNATEELRRLLDEHGVEWGTGFGDDTLWTGRHCVEWRWDKQEGTLAMYTHAITPAQAVEATLGRSWDDDCENAKLRELVKSMYYDLSHQTFPPDWVADYTEDMHELGIEVE